MLSDGWPGVMPSGYTQPRNWNVPGQPSYVNALILLRGMMNAATRNRHCSVFMSASIALLGGLASGLLDFDNLRFGRKRDYRVVRQGRWAFEKPQNTVFRGHPRFFALSNLGKDKLKAVGCEFMHSFNSPSWLSSLAWPLLCGQRRRGFQALCDYQ